MRTSSSNAMNVLIYTGNGTSATSVQQTYHSLKSILGHAYDIMKVDAATLHSEPWQDHCALMVIPGGRDLPYCHDLKHHEPNSAIQRIHDYVHHGGRYLGFSAGAYFASRHVEFEKGSTTMEVIGKRDLGFFPGTCRGTLFPGEYVFHPSEKGARAVSIDKRFKAYYNGGGYFVDADTFPNVKVVCRFDQGPAAVHCQVGQGSALLFGFHPEYNINTVDLEDHEDREEMRKTLNASLPLCRELLSRSLAEMGLSILFDKKSDVELTPLYLCTMSKELLEDIAGKLEKAVDSHSLLHDSNDVFAISQTDEESLTKRFETLSIEHTSTEKAPVIQVFYPQKSTTKDIQAPDNMNGTNFNIHLFFKYLQEWRKQEWGGGSWYKYGNAVLYSEVITSTQSILDKNFHFSQCLPSGLVCLATNQIAGRGRGRNSWVSQAGALQFSFVIRHSAQLKHAPVVFIQYLIALSIVESIRNRKGYEDIPLRLKWPNDIYVDQGGLKKVGGLLVNSNFFNDEFLLVVGCGVNLNNAYPTVSINDVIAQHDPELHRIEKEDLLAHALVTFEKYYMEFCEKGMGSWFLDQYYHRWLHSDKLVTLTTHDDERVKIVGITSDYGMLEAVSVKDPKKRFTLQPDGNSFDMLKGLIIKKT